jgi:cell division protein FtsW (lipid II flippase)
VTLPLVSYGGSSLLSTMIVFGIIQGLYIVEFDERMQIEKRKKGEALHDEKISKTWEK